MYDDFEYKKILQEIFKKKFISRGFRSLLRQLTVVDLENSFELITAYHGEFTKQQYIDIFSYEYEDILKDIFSLFSKKILDFIFYIADEAGEIVFDKLNPANAITMKLYLIAFPLIKDNEFKLIMPNEVLSTLYLFDRKKLYQNVEINDIIINLNNRLLKLYGIYDFSLLIDYLKEYEEITINTDELFLLLNIDSLYTNDYDIKDGKIFSFEIEEINNFDTLYNDDLNYYHFSKQEILNDSIMIKKQYHNLINFVEDKLETTFEMAYEAARLVDEALKLELMPEQISALFENLDITMYQRKLLEKEIEKASLNCHLWTLKGHTKNELNTQKKFISFKHINK